MRATFRGPSPPALLCTTAKQPTETWAWACGSTSRSSARMWPLASRIARAQGARRAPAHVPGVCSHASRTSRSPGSARDEWIRPNGWPTAHLVLERVACGAAFEVGWKSIGCGATLLDAAPPGRGTWGMQRDVIRKRTSMMIKPTAPSWVWGPSGAGSRALPPVRGRRTPRRRCWTHRGQNPPRRPHDRRFRWIG